MGGVNQNQMVGVQISVGSTIGPDGSQTPVYATPGAITASIGGTFTAEATGTTLTVETVLSGSLWPNDAVSGTDGTNALPTGCYIVEQLSGVPGAAGTYELSAPPSTGVLNSCTVTSASTVLNVTNVAGGVLQVGQNLSDQGALSPGTLITGYGTGNGGIGTYTVNQQQTVAGETMQTTLTALAQVQAVTGGDLRHVDALNLSGTHRIIYISLPLHSTVRAMLKGGDIVVMPDSSVWLVTQSLEPFFNTAGWQKLLITLQNDVQVAFPYQSDNQPAGVP